MQGSRRSGSGKLVQETAGVADKDVFRDGIVNRRVEDGRSKGRSVDRRVGHRDWPAAAARVDPRRSIKNPGHFVYLAAVVADIDRIREGAAVVVKRSRVGIGSA